MPKTYPDIGTFSSGDILTATTMNEIGDNLDNQRVPPMCRATLTTTQSIPNGSSTTVTFPSEDFDTDNMHSTSVNTGRLTATTAGVYLINANIIFNNNGTGQREIIIYKDSGGSASRISQVSYGSVSNAVFAELSASVVVSLAVNDFVYADVFQNSGGPLELRGNVGPNSFSAAWLGQAS